MLCSKRGALSCLLVVLCCLTCPCGCSGEKAASPTTTTVTTATEADPTTKTTTETTTAPTAVTTTSSATRSGTGTTASTMKSTETTIVPTITTPSSSPKAYSIGSVPVIPQMPDYPSVCESVSAVMVLNYWGESVTVDEFIDDYLPKSSQFYWKNSVRYGPSPYEYFLGDPRTTNAYGCMAPVIEQALTGYFGNKDRIVNTTGTTLQKLCETYIDQDIPVLTWVTIGMIESYTSDTWRLEDGTTYGWPANEHCSVLIGYDANYYYFNDPYWGTVKKYAKWLVEKRYQDMGQQSLVITE